MGAATAIRIEEYLATDYEPDVDYVDGVLEDRNVGEEPHSRIQTKLAHRLMSAGFEWVYAELRVKVSATRYRVPDLCLFLEQPQEAVPSVPPVLVIEILSPEDRMSRMQEKLDDYMRMGCGCVWVINPALRRAYGYDGKALVETEELTHPSIPALRLGVTELLPRQ